MPIVFDGLSILLVRYGYGVRSRGCRDGHISKKQTTTIRGYRSSTIQGYGGAFSSRTTRKIPKSHCRGGRGHHSRNTLLARCIHPAQQLYGEKFVGCHHLFHWRKGRHCLHHTSGSKASVLHSKHLQHPTARIRILANCQSGCCNHHHNIKFKGQISHFAPDIF